MSGMAGLPYFLDAPDQLFAALIFAVLPAWLLLIILPRAALTRVLVQSVIPAFLLGGIYALLVARAADGAMLAAPHPISLTGLMAFFETPDGVLAGLAHYLVFDLFVGAWEVRDAARRGVPHWAVIPCLLLTLVLGPLGLVLYLLVRTALDRGALSLD